MFHRRLIIGIALSVGVAGCGLDVVKRVCTGSGSSTLVGDAVLIRLDVYGAGAHCSMGMLLPGAGAPIMSHTYAKGQAIKLDVPPGPHALMLTTFADSAATMVLGQACTEANLSAGSQVCFDLTLVSPADAAVPDLSACGPGNPACQCGNDGDCSAPTPRCAPSGMCVACLPQNDNCPFDHYCDPATNMCLSGCKSNKECVDLADAGTGGRLCDPTRHTCVECVGNSDCPSGKLCNMAGMCVPGCDVAAGKLCPGSLTCCNKICVDTTNDPFNCNGCGNICNGGNTVCCSSSCKNPQTDADNCGGCGKVCSNNHMMTRTCGGGSCNGTCANNFGDCNNDKLSDGCEVDLTSATANCGACGTNCNAQEANVSGAFCNNKSCDYASCNPAATYGDCDGSRANGCETNLTNTTNHCGTCIVDCTSQEQHASGAFCNNKSCDYVSCSMPSTFQDCDGNRTNGCEDNITSDPAHCGSCGRPCSAAGVAVGGLSCSGGLCNSTCSPASLGNCTMPASPTADDGCETNLNTTTNRCGSCTTDCNVNVQNANGKACDGAGHCTYSTCTNGYGDCNSDRTDGCEITENTTAHCGSCAACDSATSQGAACSGWPAATTCTYSGCSSGWKDCVVTAPNTNGCEDHVDVDPNNCGGCGRACKNTQVAGSPTCGGGVCTSACNGGFGNCSMPAFPASDDGCESNLTTCYAQACCPSLCGPPPHSNCNNPPAACAADQLGQTYNDCVALGTPGVNGTYSQNMAQEAANAAVNQGGSSGDGVGLCGSGANLGHSWCKSTDPTWATGRCTCWQFDGTGTEAANVGHVYRSSGGSGDAGCFCPTSAADSWN